MYSSIQHAIRSIQLGHFNSDNIVAVLYSAYFDASGKSYSHTAITVAGAVAPVKKWVAFEESWNAALADEGVGTFHATDFASSLGEFQGWKGDKARRSRFVKRLGEIIKASTNKFFLATVDVDGWNSVNRQYCMEEWFGSPYSLAGFTVVGLVQNWAKRKDVRSPIEYIFEDGDELADWRGLKKNCAYLGVTPIRLPKERAVPCQIGDMLAWKTRIAKQNSLKINSRIDPSAYDPALLKEAIAELRSLGTVMNKPADNKAFDEKLLTRNCVRLGIPERSSMKMMR